MIERPRAHLVSAGSNFHLQLSKLLVGAIIAATAATGALIIAILADMPGDPPAPGPNGLPPPPPNLRPLAIFPVITGLFVLAWLAVIVVYSRDQLLRRIQEVQLAGDPDAQTSRQHLHDMITALRGQLAEDRERELAVLEERIASLTSEYGEQRETDGYLNGICAATQSGAPKADVRSIRRTPPA